MLSQLSKPSSSLSFVLLLTPALLSLATSLSQSSPNTMYETLPAALSSSSNFSTASTFDFDLEATDPSTVTNDTTCFAPVAFPVNPKQDCYDVIQYYLQNYPFYRNYTLTRRRIPSEKYMTVPKIFGYRTCYLTIDIVKSSPTIKAVGSSVTQWLWDLYVECFQTDDPSNSGGGGTVVDYLWDDGKRPEHNEFKISLRTRKNPFPHPSQSSSASATGSATASAAAAVAKMDITEIETS